MSEDWKDDKFFEELAAGSVKLKLEPEPEPDRMEILGRSREAGFKLLLRFLVFAVVLVMCVYIVRANSVDLNYFLLRAQPAVELGDLRAPSFSAERLNWLDTNALVAFSNDVVTMDRIRTDDHEFYFSPVASWIVRTKQTLPDKSAYEELTVELDQWEADLVMAKKAFPEDLKVSFSGRGRFIRNADLPAWVKPLLRYYSRGSGIPEAQIHLVLDGEEPGDSWTAVLVLLAVFFVCGVTGTLFFRAVFQFVRARKGAVV